MTVAPFRVFVDDDGAAVVEYAIILAGISLVAIGALQTMGVSLNGLYSNVVANWSSTAHSGQ
jgi:Flp pilus assembly pilin Flp